MIDKPLVARLKKEGPEVLIRKMRAKNITVLPVIDADDKLVGEVRLNDLLKLRSKQENPLKRLCVQKYILCWRIRCWRIYFL